METITIQNDPCDSQFLISPCRRSAVEPHVGRLAAEIVTNPGGRDILGVASNGSLEALNDEVGVVQLLIWEILWLWVV